MCGICYNVGMSMLAFRRTEQMAKAEATRDNVLEIPSEVKVTRDVSLDKTWLKSHEPIPIDIVVDFTQCTPEDVLAFAVRTAVINLQGKIRNLWGHKDPDKREVPTAGAEYRYVVKAPPVKLSDKESLKRHLATMKPSERKAYIEEILEDLAS